jgi:hypothetical protein
MLFGSHLEQFKLNEAIDGRIILEDGWRLEQLLHLQLQPVNGGPCRRRSLQLAYRSFCLPSQHSPHPRGGVAA